MNDSVEEYLNGLTKYEIKEDSPSIDNIKKRIREIEYAILHTRKTSRIRQNEKNLQQANQKLQMAIYQYNKMDVFSVISEAMDFMMTDYLEQRLNNFAEVGNDIGIITSPMQIEPSKVTTNYSEYPKDVYCGMNNISQQLTNKENE